MHIMMLLLGEHFLGRDVLKTCSQLPIGLIARVVATRKAIRMLSISIAFGARLNSNSLIYFMKRKIFILASSLLDIFGR